MKQNGEEPKKPTILWGTSYRTLDVDDDIVESFKSDDFVKFPGADCNVTFEEAVRLARSANGRLFGDDANASSLSFDTLPLFPKAPQKGEEREEEEVTGDGETIDLNEDEYALLRDL